MFMASQKFLRNSLTPSDSLACFDPAQAQGQLMGVLQKRGLEEERNIGAWAEGMAGWLRHRTSDIKDVAQFSLYRVTLFRAYTFL